MSDQHVIGREAIAFELGTCPKTVTNLIKRGLLKCSKAGPYANSLLTASADEIRRVRAILNGEQEVAE